jgi:hypothetical protein
MKETGSSRAIMGNVKDNAGNIGNGIIGGLIDSTRGLACWENHSKGPCVSGSLMGDNGHAFPEKAPNRDKRPVAIGFFIWRQSPVQWREEPHGLCCGVNKTRNCNDRC